MSAAEEFRTDTFVGDETWGELAAHLDDLQLLELLSVIGQFTTIAFILNSLRIPLEPNNRGFLQP